MLLAGMALALVSLWLYLPQLRGVPRRWQLLLPGMRLAVVGLLMLSLLKPAVLRLKSGDEQPALVVLIDQSLSMGVADREYSSAQQVALTDALGALPPGVRQLVGQRLRELMEVFRTQLAQVAHLLADVDYARLSGRGEEAAGARLDEALKRATATAAQFRSALDGVAFSEEQREEMIAIARWPEAGAVAQWARKSGDVLARAQRRLTDLQGDADKLRYQTEKVVKQAGEQILAESRLRLAERAITAPDLGLLDRLPPDVPLFGFSYGGELRPVPLRAAAEPARRLALEPAGGGQTLPRAVTEALQSLRGREVQAVVVVTDGRQPGGAPGEWRSPVPIYPLQCGGENSVRDLAIDALEAPVSPFAGETIRVRVRVRSLGLSAKELPVSLTLGGHLVETRMVTVAANQLASAEFEVKLPAAGVHELQASIPVNAAEATPANNASRRLVKVHETKLRVAVLAGVAGWDYQYVRNGLSRSPWASLTEQVIGPGEKLALRPELLAQQDVILLFNVAPAALEASHWQELRRAVIDRGSGLFIIAPEAQALQEYENHVVAAEFLPYTGRAHWQHWRGEAPAVRVAPVAEAASEPSLCLADETDESRRRWAQLPSIYHYIAMPQLKVGAVRRLLEEPSARAPLLTESRVGAGWVYFLALDETWRWRRGIGDRDHERLWLQLVRSAAMEPYALSSGPLALDLERLETSAEEPVRVRVGVDAAAAGVLPQLRVLAGGQLVREERLQQEANRPPGRYTAQLGALPPGEYTVEASLRDPAGERRLTMPLAVGAPVAAELANVAADPAYLKQLAASSGGEWFTLDRLAELPRRLSRLREESAQPVEVRLWDSWLLYAAVLSLLAAEWACRKGVGLP